MAEPHDDQELGAGLVNATFAGTGALVATSLAAAALPDTLGVVHALLSGVLFTIGTGALLWAYALGVSRSRTEDVTLGGLFFLSGDAAPAEVRKRFRVVLAVEVVVVVVAASIRPFSVVAFGVLAPMYGLGLMGVWGGRYATFAPKLEREAT